MYRETSALILYGGIGPDGILAALSDVFFDWENVRCEKRALVLRIHEQIRRLLALAEQYSFQEDLWRDYLALLIANSENAFSLACERGNPCDSTLGRIALADLGALRRLAEFDFAPIEAELGISCFSALTHYRAPCGAQAPSALHAFADEIFRTESDEALLRAVASRYRRYGAGKLGFSRAFRVQEEGGGTALIPVPDPEPITLDDLVGYDEQKSALRDNVSAFVEGRGGNNMLLYGDAGTGKSTSVKAVLNEYFDAGLRVVELYKHQFRLLPQLIALLRGRACHFLIFIDDLSFEESEADYKFLKAVIEGGIQARPDNVRICATSNRRHLIRETWNDRSDMEHDGDLHRSDTIEEKLSLAARFGCAIRFPSPSRAQYHDIVRALAQRENIPIDEDMLLNESNRWELRHGGVSGRAARQFVTHIAATSRK